jgi:hypothetical protein
MIAQCRLPSWSGEVFAEADNACEWLPASLKLMGFSQRLRQNSQAKQGAFFGTANNQYERRP